MSNALDRLALLKRLERIEEKESSGRDQEQLSTMNLAGALLSLAEIDHEREYYMLRGLAEHLLGSAPEPDDVDMLDQ